MKFLAQCATDTYGEKTYGIAEREDKTGRIVLWLDELELMTYIEDGNEVAGVTFKNGKLTCVVQSSHGAKLAAARTAIISGFPLSLDNDMYITSFTVPYENAVFDCGKEVVGITSEVHIDKTVTIILHDTTKEGYTFVEFANTNVVRGQVDVTLDLHDVTDEELLKSIYYNYAAIWVNYEYDPIDDHEGRKERLLKWAEGEVEAENMSREDYEDMEGYY